MILEIKAIANWLCDGKATATDFFTIYDRMQNEPEWRNWFLTTIEAEYRAEHAITSTPL